MINEGGREGKRVFQMNVSVCVYECLRMSVCECETANGRKSWLPSFKNIFES